MDRPKFSDYWSDGLVTHDSDYKDYIDEIEKYCDYLEKVVDNASHQLMRFVQCDHRCPMKEDHCMITNWECKRKWKEWLLNNE